MESRTAKKATPRKKAKGVRRLFNVAATGTVAIPLALMSASGAFAQSQPNNVLDHSAQPKIESVYSRGFADGTPVRHDLLRSYQAKKPVQIAQNIGTHANTLGTMPVATAGFSVGPITFAAPWMLLGLLALPLLWWLMRTQPPRPTRHRFPPIRLLFKMKSEDQKPADMPLWHRILRMIAVGTLVFGLADPKINPDKPFAAGTGPVMIVIDNGWASAKNWENRIARLRYLIGQAESTGRSIIFLSTAPSAETGKIKLTAPLNAEDARKFVESLKANPWPVSREAALKALNAMRDHTPSSVIWLSNGIDRGHSAKLIEKLQSYGALSVVTDGTARSPRLLVPAEQTDGGKLRVIVRRLNGAHDETVTLTASDERGNPISQIKVTFKAGQTETTAEFDLPTEIRNQLTRITLEGGNHAGATLLLDERWKRRPVGVISVNTATQSQPLLSGTNYVTQALNPFANVSNGNIIELLKQQLAVMVMTDSVSTNTEERRAIKHWIEKGGTLVRFAGPRMAANPENDDMLPVELRNGVRVLGGKMSGSPVGKIAPFDAKSPLHGITIPDNVEISKQVLAQPGLELEGRVWARLKDGTPFITAKKQGKGWIVLIHTTANNDWSNLSLSGAFIDIMRAIVKHSQGVSSKNNLGNTALPPLRVLDADGRLINPGNHVRPLTGQAIKDNQVGPKHPPGFYGSQESRYAHNLSTAVRQLTPLASTLPKGVSVSTYGKANKEIDLSGILLAIALGLLAVDGLIRAHQQGAVPGTGNSAASRRRRRKKDSGKARPKANNAS